MRSIAEALDSMLPAFPPRAAVRAPLDAGHGLFVAEPVRAREDVPPFDNSAMDGWAMRAGDVEAATDESPVTLAVAGESRAGGPLPEALAAGRAMRIFTGAPMPPGADTVVMQERTDHDGEQVRIFGAHRGGAHVRSRGEDLAEGTVFLDAGAQVDAGAIGLLSSQGYAYVRVHRRPRVAILSTGDELRDADAPPSPGTIVDSNSYALAAQVREAGGEPVVLSRARDDLDAITARIQEGLRADVLLTSGGVSVGEYDLVHRAFERAGVEMGFWKVAIKPGKPLAFGSAPGAPVVPVVGLPGNPVSAMITFEILVRPGLRRMLGDPRPHSTPVGVRLGGPHRHRPGRTELVRARLSRRGRDLVAELHPRQGSASLTSMVNVDALVVVPGERADVEAGESLLALPLRERVGSATSVF